MIVQKFRYYEDIGTLDKEKLGLEIIHNIILLFYSPKLLLFLELSYSILQLRSFQLWLMVFPFLIASETLAD